MNNEEFIKVIKEQEQEGAKDRLFKEYFLLTNQKSTKEAEDYAAMTNHTPLRQPSILDHVNEIQGHLEHTSTVIFRLHDLLHEVIIDDNNNPFNCAKVEVVKGAPIKTSSLNIRLYNINAHIKWLNELLDTLVNSLDLGKVKL